MVAYQLHKLFSRALSYDESIMKMLLLDAPRPCSVRARARLPILYLHLNHCVARAR